MLRMSKYLTKDISSRGSKTLFYAMLVFSVLVPVASGAVPLSLSIESLSSRVSPCRRDSKVNTYGVDLGLLSSGRCVLAGIQIAPLAGSEKMYGIQLSPIGSGVSDGYGIQVAGVIAQSSHKFSGIIIAGLVTNLTMEGGCPDVNGLQVSGLANMAGDFNGAQISFINYAGLANGVQIGGLNIQESHFKSWGLFQIGIYNRADSLGGAQLGIYNYARHVSGVQLGVINKVESLHGVQLGAVNIISPKYRKLKLPFFPIINAAF